MYQPNHSSDIRVGTSISPSNQQNSHRGHDQRNDRHGSDRQGGSSNYRILVLDATKGTGVSSPTDLPTLVPKQNRRPNRGLYLPSLPPHVDVDTQESVRRAAVIVLSASSWSSSARIGKKNTGAISSWIC
ncbi:hypothetical protein Tco_0337049 [Tanacetum coccineum]